jgi:hypothetical protein
MNRQPGAIIASARAHSRLFRGGPGFNDSPALLRRSDQVAAASSRLNQPQFLQGSPVSIERGGREGQIADRSSQSANGFRCLAV